jgi:hypothetical protein
MDKILSKKSYIGENDKFVQEEERKEEEEKSLDDIYSLVDKAYYIDELHYKIGT